MGSGFWLGSTSRQDLACMEYQSNCVVVAGARKELMWSPVLRWSPDWGQEPGSGQPQSQSKSLSDGVHYSALKSLPPWVCSDSGSSQQCLLVQAEVQILLYWGLAGPTSLPQVPSPCPNTISHSASSPDTLLAPCPSNSIHQGILFNRTV